jgi:diguanylate cyclase (GGDEF)-like protein
MDVRTAIQITALLSLLTGLSLRYVQRDYPEEFAPSIRLWLLGLLLQPSAWLLYGLRDLAPDWLTMVVANGLLGYAFALHTRALWSFAGRRLSPWASDLPVVLIVVCEIVFTYFLPSMRLRVVTVSALLAVLTACAAFVLLDEHGPRRRSHRLTATAFLVLTGVLLIRIVYEGFRPGSLVHALATSWMQTAVFGLAAFFPTLATLGFVLMAGDRLHQELERQATLDPLTGIANRRTLSQLATRAVAQHQRHSRALALLLIDADHFKQINDELGHDVGDEALRTLAAVLQCTLRSEDLLGRLGGEEFVALLPETDAVAANTIAEWLRIAVEQTEFLVAQRLMPLKISIGIAVLRPGDEFTDLLRRADRAMYLAKSTGRNRVCGPLPAPCTPAVGIGEFPS